MSNCVFCQKEVEVIDRVGVRDDCPHCDESLHCCLQCQFYDEKSFHECHEKVDNRVEHKDKANYCDLFKFGRDAAVKTADKDKIKSEMDKLFKK